MYRMQASHARGTFDTKSQNIRIWSNESRIQTRLFRVEASDKKKKKIHVLDACRKKMVNGGAMNEFGAAGEASFDPLGKPRQKVSVLRCLSLIVDQRTMNIKRCKF